MRGGRLIGGQRQIQVDLAEKEIGARIPIDQIRVFADPAQSRIACQRLFQNRCAIDKCAVAKRTDPLANAIAKPLQASAHEFVIIAAQRVARHVRDAAIAERGLRIGGIVPASSPCGR